MRWRRRWSEVEAVTSGGDERGHLGQSPPSRRTERTRDTCHSRVMADTALLPVDMSKQEKSPPPLTKLVHRKPSSPREFFEKLYGPDTKDTKDTAKDREAEDRSPSPPLSPDPDLAKTHGHPHHGAGGLAAAAAGGGYHHLNLNNNGPASLVGVAGAGAGLHPSPSSSYLPAFPLPPHEVGILNMDNVPFPGGLAAFCKS